MPNRGVMRSICLLSAIFAGLAGVYASPEIEWDKMPKGMIAIAPEYKTGQSFFYISQFAIDWKTFVNRKNAVTGQPAPNPSEKKQEANQNIDRPILALIGHSDPNQSEMRKLNKSILPDEIVGVGSKFFHCLLIPERQAAEDSNFKGIHLGSPAIVFFTETFEIRSVLQRRDLKVENVVQSMKKLVSEYYENDFDKTVQEYLKLLGKMDKLEEARLRIEEQEKRSGKDAAKSADQRTEKKLQKIQDAMEQCKKKGAEILNFRRKGQEVE